MCRQAVVLERDVSSLQQQQQQHIVADFTGPPAGRCAQAAQHSTAQRSSAPSREDYLMSAQDAARCSSPLLSARLPGSAGCAHAGFMVEEGEGEEGEGCLRGPALHLEVNGFSLPEAFSVVVVVHVMWKTSD